MTIIFPDSDLLSEADQLANHLDYNLNQSNLPGLGQTWFDPSESNAAHQELSGCLQVAGQIDSRTTNASGTATLTYTATAEIRLEIRAATNYLTSRQGINAWVWLGNVLQKLGETGAITASSANFVEAWAGGRIIRLTRSEERIQNPSGDSSQIISIIEGEYHWSKYGNL